MSFIHSKDYVSDLDAKCIQPNAVDLRLASLEEFTEQFYEAEAPHIFISESGGKQFAPRNESPVRYEDKRGSGYVLYPRRSYDVVTKHKVRIPEGAVGWCHIRSTLSRNGLILSGGLYDAGYDGVIGFTIHNLSPNYIHLEDNVRIAQFIMGHSETAHTYDGYYNQNGGHSK